MLTAEIIAVGSELLTPFRTDTNSLWLTDRLNSIGVEVKLKTIVVVADDGLEFDFDAYRVEPVGQPEAVRVRAERRQQFGADGDDFGGQHAGDCNSAAV